MAIILYLTYITSSLSLTLTCYCGAAWDGAYARVGRCSGAENLLVEFLFMRYSLLYQPSLCCWHLLPPVLHNRCLRRTSALSRRTPGS